MNLGTLLFGSAGILALLVMAAALGLRRLRLLTGEDEVRAMALEAEPEATVCELAIDADRRAALALLGDGRVFAVRTLGDRLVQRVFAVRAIRKMPRVCTKGKGVAVRIAFADWGFPSLILRFDGSEPPPWLAHFGQKRSSRFVSENAHDQIGFASKPVKSASDFTDDAIERLRRSAAE